KLEFRVAFDVGPRAARAREHAAFARGEQRVGSVTAATVSEGTVLGHLSQEIEMLHKGGLVDAQTCVQTVETIVLRGVGNVMPGGERFKLNPGRPAGGVTALHAG